MKRKMLSVKCLFIGRLQQKVCNLEILLCSELDALRQDSVRRSQRIIEQIGRGVETEDRLQLLLDSLKV
jgi:hypothetical protein